MCSGEADLFRVSIENLENGLLFESIPIDRCTAGEKLVQENAQGIDVAPGVDIQRIHLGLFGTHVLERSDDLTEFGEERSVGQSRLVTEGLG